MRPAGGHLLHPPRPSRLAARRTATAPPPRLETRGLPNPGASPKSQAFASWRLSSGHFQVAFQEEGFILGLLRFYFSK